MTGLFISFEGIDGAGKSTHIEDLALAFEAQGRRVTRTREPGGTPLAEKLRHILLQDPMDAMTEALLVFAARRDHLQQLIEPALADGQVVLSDRFSDATFAYQGGGRGFELAVLTWLEQQVQALPGGVLRQPELTLWFDLDPLLAAQRLSHARTPDKFEAQPLEFFRRVAKAYGQRMAQAPQRFVKIDAGRDRQTVRLDVLTAVRRKGWLV